MSELPSREETRQMLDSPDTWEWISLYAPREVLGAYADGELLTRAEWEASTEVVVSGSVTTIIDYEAAVEFALSEVEKGLVFTEEEYEQAMRTQVHGIVNAALNIEEDS